MEEPREEKDSSAEAITDASDTPAGGSDGGEVLDSTHISTDTNDVTEESGTKEESVSAAPHRLTIVNDYTKTVITLATGLLAVTVTFSTQLLVAQSSLSLFFLLVSWVCLVAAIAFALMTAAFINVYLGLAEKDSLSEEEKAKKQDRFKKSLSYCSYSFYLLVLAAALFVGVGAKRILSRPKGCNEITATQRSLEAISGVHGVPQNRLMIESLDWDDSAGTYTFRLRDSETSNKYTAIVDIKLCKIIKSRRDY